MRHCSTPCRLTCPRHNSVLIGASGEIAQIDGVPDLDNRTTGTGALLAAERGDGTAIRTEGHLEVDVVVGFAESGKQLSGLGMPHTDITEPDSHDSAAIGAESERHPALAGPDEFIREPARPDVPKSHQRIISNGGHPYHPLAIHRHSPFFQWPIASGTKGAEGPRSRREKACGMTRLQEASLRRM